MDDEKLQSLTVAELEKLVRYHNRLYWELHAPELTDYEYDRLVTRLKSLAPDSPCLVEMGTESPGETQPGEAVTHEHKMLSLDKCYSETELTKWAGEFDGPVLMSPKFDGIACSLRYNAKGELLQAATRGDGAVGENITQNARSIADIPKKLSAGALEVRGEIFMRLSVFQSFKDQGFANPRNLAAGAIKQKSAEKSAAYKLSFAAYDLLGTELSTEAEKMERLAALGFPPIERKLLEKNALQSGYEDLAQRRSGLDFEIDGVVFKADRVAEQKRLGSTAHHPRYAMAYKFQGDSGTTMLRGIEWSVARTGAITPVGIIDPVNLSGAMVSRASLHHPGFIDKLGLKADSEVVVMRRGGVIPNLEFVTKPGDKVLELPASCPSCGGPTRRDKDFLFCVKPSQCRSAVIGRMAHYATTTGMLGFGDVVLAGAYDKALLRTPADFYTLTVEGLQTLERLGEKTAKKLVAEVDRTRKLELATFLRAFGIHELGKHVSALLQDRYQTLEKVLALTFEELAAVHSIGEVIARSVVDGLAAGRAELEAVLKHVTLEGPAPAVTEAVQSGALAGKTVVFTGKMATMERKAAEALVRSHGGTPLDAVNKTLSYLVVGDKKTEDKSTKQKAAEKLIAQGAAIQVVGESEFLAKLSQVPAAPTNPVVAPGEKPVQLSPEMPAPSAPSVVVQPEVSVASVPGAKLESHVEPKLGTLGTELSSTQGKRLEGRVFALAGKLTGLSKEAAKLAVENEGGRWLETLTDELTDLVVGAKGKPGQALIDVRARQAKGDSVVVLEEPAFLALLPKGQRLLF